MIDEVMLTLHALFIRCDRGTFDADIVALDSMSCFDGHLIVGFITIFQAQIVVLAVHIDVWKHKLEEKQQLAFFSLDRWLPSL